jgi:glycosyltransferase involved in cell wall biosynthesis
LVNSDTLDYKSNKKILVCIPAYNEAKHIGDIIHNAKAYCTEVIICDDGSVDNTREVAKAAGATVIRHDSNKGYGAAIRTLFETAKTKDADIMITLDSDGQHDANDIPKIVEPIIKQEADMVIGSRFLVNDDEKKVPAYRRLGIKAITRLTQATSYPNITDSQNGFRAYGKNALSKLNLYEDGMAISTEILIRAKEKNLTIKEVPITVTYETDDTSTHSPISHGASVMHSVIQFISLRHPLLFYGLSGVGLLIVGIIFMSSALEIFSHTRYVSTPSILLSMGFVIVGIVLLATGAIIYTMKALIRDKLKDR